MKERIETGESLQCNRRRRAAAAIAVLPLLMGCSEGNSGDDKEVVGIEMDGLLAEYDEEDERTNILHTVDEEAADDLSALDTPQLVATLRTRDGETVTLGCSGAQEIEVEQGDTLHEIAGNVDLYWGYIDQPVPERAHVVSVVSEINDVAEPDHILAGSELVVPRSCDTDREGYFEAKVE